MIAPSLSPFSIRDERAARSTSGPAAGGRTTDPTCRRGPACWRSTVRTEARSASSPSAGRARESRGSAEDLIACLHEILIEGHRDLDAASLHDQEAHLIH